jgi:hypothetical protein
VTTLAPHRGHVCLVCRRIDTIYPVHLVWATRPLPTIRVNECELAVTEWAAVCSGECLEQLSPEFVLRAGVPPRDWKKIGDHYVEFGELLPKERPGAKS